MVNRLVASSAGIAVETVVSAVAQRKDVDAAPSPATTAEAARESGKEGDSFLEMILRIEEHDWQGADEAYQSGLHIAREKGRDEAVHWEALYDFERAITGHPTALDELRALAESNPENPTPLAFLGSCLFDFKQYTEAADCYRSASLLCKSDDATGHLIRAANCLRLAKKLDEARETLINSWNSTPTAKRELRSKILRGLYSVLKDSGDSFQAFAIGEAALHYNPSQSDLRFSLGFDYETAGYFELNVHHFRLICEKDPRNAGALNNLGVAYSNLGLAINSATSYRLALQYESTLAASNLGYRYLNAGMAEDAAEILLEAQKKKDCVPEVTRCLSAVDERRKEEDEKAASALESARKHQDFLVSFGMGYISGVSPALAGDWAFPFGKITLRLGSGRLEGEVMIKVPEPPNVGLGRWLGGLSAPTSDPRVERVQFLGEVCGRTCKYKIIRKDV